MLEVDEKYIDMLTEGLYLLSSGRKARLLEIPEELPDNELRQLFKYYNRLIGEFEHAADFSYALSRGDLDYNQNQGNMVIMQSFKSLQASLKHLTWITQQIAGGDFNHQVDFMGDFSVAFNEMTRQLKEAFETINAQNRQINTLLESILPPRVIDELNTYGYSAPRQFNDVTVFFSDFVGFTKSAQHVDPVTLIDELNSIFKEFDHIVSSNCGERIKTIGDAYLAVWGMNEQLPDHAERAVDAALQILDFLHKRNADWFFKWEVRIGLHSGSIVGGIVGDTKYIYDVFGDTVNTAARMESNSEAMRINISDELYQLVKDKFNTAARNVIYVKGKGECAMHFVEGKREC